MRPNDFYFIEFIIQNPIMIPVFIVWLLGFFGVAQIYKYLLTLSLSVTTLATITMIIVFVWFIVLILGIYFVYKRSEY